MATIRINNGKETYDVPTSTSLYHALSDAGVYLPSACGGRGMCGRCRIVVRTPMGDYTERELAKLSETDRADGFRLACQIPATGEMDIEIPDDVLAIKRYHGEVDAITTLTHDVKEVRVKLANGSSVDFTAGQFALVQIPPYGEHATKTERSYSFVSTPSEKGYAKFLIKRVPNGVGSTYIHDVLKAGDAFEFVGPFGEFRLRETPNTAIFIAGGSGMSSTTSAITDMYERGIVQKETWLFFGARSKKDLFYLDVFEGLASRYSSFHFVPALSEPADVDAWEGEVGLITDVTRKYLTSIVGNAVPKEGYLCGAPGMITSGVALLTDCGIEESAIYFDKF